jgi:mannose/fructose/N-acetylgalactosamine-specific phosphotransferase system component IIB
LYEKTVTCKIIIITNNTSQAQKMKQPLLITASKNGGVMKVRVGDLIKQLTKPVLDKVRNFMVSYFCHKMRSFINIGSN